MKYKFYLAWCTLVVIVATIVAYDKCSVAFNSVYPKKIYIVPSNEELMTMDRKNIGSINAKFAGDIIFNLAQELKKSKDLS